MPTLLSRILLCLALLLAALPAAAVQGLVGVPALKTRVTDNTGTLSAEQKSALESKLAAFETARGSQIAILMLDSTQPETIEQYGIRVAEAWKLGRKGKDDGVLILVAKSDHKLRIEVGYGLEGALNDAVSKRIVAEIMAPRFKQGDWAGGLNAGVEQIQKVIEGEALPAPAAQVRASGQSELPGDWQQALMVGVVGAAILGGFLATLLGRLLGGLATGGIVGFIALLFSGSLLVSIGVGCAVFLLVLVRGGGHWGGSGWSSGGGSSSGGSSSWGGGGGGSFGGGGASGDW